MSHTTHGLTLSVNHDVYVLYSDSIGLIKSGYLKVDNLTSDVAGLLLELLGNRVIPPGSKCAVKLYAYPYLLVPNYLYSDGLAQQILPQTGFDSTTVHTQHFVPKLDAYICYHCPVDVQKFDYPITVEHSLVTYLPVMLSCIKSGRFNLLAVLNETHLDILVFKESNLIYADNFANDHHSNYSYYFYLICQVLALDYEQVAITAFSDNAVRLQKFDILNRKFKRFLLEFKSGVLLANTL